MDHDLEKVHEFYHDDIVVEIPQSSERIRGKQNIYELRSHYSSKTSYKILRVRGDGNLWITEVIVTYDNDKGRPVYGVAIMEFRNDKVAHETLYFADPFEPPEWRSWWVEIIKEPLTLAHGRVRINISSAMTLLNSYWFMFIYFSTETQVSGLFDFISIPTQL